MGAWFTREIADTGRLRLFCFFVAFIAGFLFIRFSVRMIRRQARWWPGNVAPGGRQAVLFGAEGAGLPKPILDRLRSVRIAMKGGFDSLNVATTSGIVLHHLAR